jgi:hypothetical protein
MQLKISDNQLLPNPTITKPVDCDILLQADHRYFDKDGYELNYQERLFHKNSNITIDEGHLFHTANHVTWFYDKEQSQNQLVLDHSTLNMRWNYTGAAREQIKELAIHKPSLNKLLGVVQKWGIDFSLDYVYTGHCLEVFHIEADYLNYDEAMVDKEKAEQLILNTDWWDGARCLLRDADKWSHLNSDDQADYKSKYFGWKRAFDNRKVFNFAA